MYRFFPREVSALKVHAKSLKKQMRCTHAQALDYVARVNGYTNWSLLQKHAHKEGGRKDPARIFGERKRQNGERIIQVAAIRYAPGIDENPYDPGQLIFRCPECGEIHYHGAIDWFLGAGNGTRIPHCQHKREKGYEFDLVETLEPAFAGALPKAILKHFVPPTEDEQIKAWFEANHELAIERTPWESKEGGYQYPIYEGPYDIQDALWGEFPGIDEGRLSTLAEELYEEGPWLHPGLLLDTDDEKAMGADVMESIDWVGLIGGGFAYQTAPFASHPKDRERAEEYLLEAKAHGLTTADAVQHAREYLSTTQGWPTNEDAQLRHVIEFFTGKLPSLGPDEPPMASWI